MNSSSIIISGIGEVKRDAMNDKIHSLDNETFTAYMNALGFNSEIPPARSLQTVETLLYQHASKFAFTTFPANFGDEVKLTATDLTQYMLKNGQGYCFHHNVAIGAALRHLGFDITFVAASIRKSNDSDEVFPLATHVVVLLKMEDKEYLLDPGWSAGIIEALPLNSSNSLSTKKYQTTALAGGKFGLVEKTATGHEVKYEFTRTPVSLDACKDALANVMSKDHFFYGIFFYSIVTGKNEICTVTNHTFTRSTLDGVMEDGITLDRVEYGNLSFVDILNRHLAPEQKLLAQISEARFVNTDLGRSVMHPKNASVGDAKAVIINKI